MQKVVYRTKFSNYAVAFTNLLYNSVSLQQRHPFLLVENSILSSYLKYFLYFDINYITSTKCDAQRSCGMIATPA